MAFMNLQNFSGTIGLQEVTFLGKQKVQVKWLCALIDFYSLFKNRTLHVICAILRVINEV